MQLIIMVCMFIHLCGTYFIWPSRWNIPTHLTLSLFFAAFFLPCLFTDIANSFPPDVLNFTVNILVVGSITYLTGLIVGNFAYAPIHRLLQRQRRESQSDSLRLYNFVTRSYIWIIFGCACMAIAFAGMGFIPALAKSPLEAKFFRGQYAAPYHRVQIIYRSGLVINSLLVTVEFCSWLDTKKTKHLIMVFIAALLMALGLVRGPAVTGIMLAMGLFVARRSRAVILIYWASIVVIFCFGSVSLYLLFLLNGSLTPDMYDKSIAALIASGAPDLSDMLTFIQAFKQMPEFTYGRTFIGGLIPNHFQWNPAVWTLHILNPNTDLSEIASGGLRLPLAIWGYVSFGWVGVFVVPLFSGLLQGGFIAYIKTKIAESRSLIESCVTLMMYMYVYVLIYNFYDIDIYQIPPLLILIFLTSQIKFQLSPNVRSLAWSR